MSKMLKHKLVTRGDTQYIIVKSPVSKLKFTYPVIDILDNWDAFHTLYPNGDYIGSLGIKLDTGIPDKIYVYQTMRHFMKE